MVLNKWNYKWGKYDKVEVPDLNYKIYSTDMNEIVNCPHCKREFEYGYGYTSKEFHTDYGFGYAVCEKCYAKEFADFVLDQEKKVKNEKHNN